MAAAHLVLVLNIFSLANAFLTVTQNFLKETPSAQSFASCAVPPVPYASPEQIGDRMSEYLEQCAENISKIINEYEDFVGGTVFNVIYKDKIIWSKGFGKRDMSKSVPDNAVDGDTIFRIGSITKVFTAMLMFLFKDAGAIESLDDDVQVVLGEFKIKNPYQQNRAITYNQLASHMSCVPTEVPCPATNFNGCSLPYNEIYDKISELEVLCPPGTWPQYSNLGISILGRAVEQVSGGDTWENLLEEMILKPLAMDSSGASVSPDLMEHLAVGYSPDGVVAKQIDIGFESPAGQMYSTPNDLSKFMMSIMNNIYSIHPLENSLLDSETLREWMEPVYIYKDGTGYARPWEITPSYSYTLRTKAGAINGYQSQILMLPEIQAGVVVMKNCLGCPAYPQFVEIGKDIINTLANHLLDTDLLPPPKLPPNPLEYGGNYTGLVVPNTPETKITVYMGDYYGQEVMYSQSSGIVVKLDWREDLKDTFQTSASGMSVLCAVLPRGTGQFIEFLRSASGEINGLTFPGSFPGIIFKKM